jgi:predicted anti-sigma-YlaC factor YlaD
MTALACARVRVLLESYVDGDLGRDNHTLAADVTQHLSTCADCRRQHHQAVSLPFRLKALTSPAPRTTFAADVMRSIDPERSTYRRSWTLLLPEGVLAAFILWYLSGLDGLGSIASGIFTDLQGLAGWGEGAGSLPSTPRVDVLLLMALIALTAVAGYHLTLLIRLAASEPTRHAAR